MHCRSWESSRSSKRADSSGPSTHGCISTQTHTHGYRRRGSSARFSKEGPRSSRPVARPASRVVAGVGNRCISSFFGAVEFGSTLSLGQSTPRDLKRFLQRCAPSSLTPTPKSRYRVRMRLGHAASPDATGTRSSSAGRRAIRWCSSVAGDPGLSRSPRAVGRRSGRGAPIR